MRRALASPFAAIVLVHCVHPLGEPPPRVTPKPPEVEKPWGVGCKACWREVKT